jgi:hypothetical protein
MGQNHIIQGLWIGGRLSAMQRLSIRSFLANGHEYHLYVYGDVAGVPPGTVLKDARQILPASAVFRNRDFDTFAAFSDFFRYRLLLENGGCWSDLDVVCLKRFDFQAEYVFSAQHCPDETTTETVTTAVIKTPKGAAILDYAWKTCCSKDPLQLAWTEVGPDLLRDAVAKYGLSQYVRTAATFCPVPWYRWYQVLNPLASSGFGEDTYAVHLWHEMWRRQGMDTDASHSPDCTYETLKRRFLAKTGEINEGADRRVV